MTNNPRKIVGLEGYGLNVTEQVPLEVASCPDEHRVPAHEEGEDGAHALASTRIARPRAEGSQLDEQRYEGH